MKGNSKGLRWTKKLKVAVASLATAAAVALGGAFTAIGVSVAARNRQLGGLPAGSVADNNTQTSVTVGQTIEVKTASDWEQVVAIESSATSYAEAKLTANITADSTTHLFGEGTVNTGAYFNGALNVPAGKYIVLDLNGYTVNRGLTEAVENGSVMTNYGNFVIRDTSTSGIGKITGGNTTGTGGGVLTRGGSTLEIYGGSISGNNANEGGGAYVVGNFTMAGGKITNNTATGGGGLVAYLTKNVTISGGEISNNTSTTGIGGGVLVYDGKINMSGGTITQNNAKTHGGGLYIGGSSLVSVTGGTISGNTATNNGGGVYSVATGEKNDDGSVKAYGLTISCIL